MVIIPEWLTYPMAHEILLPQIHDLQSLLRDELIPPPSVEESSPLEEHEQQGKETVDSKENLSHEEPPSPSPDTDTSASQ